jgi:cytochrome c-type biogenesis protein CcmE
MPYRSDVEGLLARRAVLLGEVAELRSRATDLTDLQAAHEREIVALDAAIAMRKRRTASACCGGKEPPARSKQARRADLTFGGGALIVGATLAGATLAASPEPVQPVALGELVIHRGAHVGHVLRTDGTLVHGTMKHREAPCEYRFSLTRDGVTLPVVYRQCIVPDTFRDRAGKDLDVGLEGELQEDGVFEATELFARCTGGYVMGQQSE